MSIVLFNIAITIIFIASFTINSKVFKKSMNYLSIFVGMYYIVTILSTINPFGFYLPTIKTYICLWIGVVCIEFFSILFLSIKSKISPLTITKKINKRRITIIAIIITILMIPSTLEGIEIYKLYGFTGIRSAAFSNEVFSTYTKLFFTCILNPMNKAIFIYALIEIIKKNKVKLAFVLSVFNIIQSVFIFGGRSVLLDAVLLTLVTIYLKNDASLKSILKNHKKLILLVIFALVFMIAITSDRNITKDGNIFINVYSYYVGSIHLLDVHLNNPSISLLDGNHLLYGQAMLSPFFEIAKIMIKMIGINYDYRTGIEVVNEQAQLFLNVSSNVKMNNNVTFIYVCLRDFDYLGLAIGPAYISLWLSAIYKYYIKKKNEVSGALYYYMCSIIPYFVFMFQINNLNFIMTIIFIIVIYLICYSKSKEEVAK